MPTLPIKIGEMYIKYDNKGHAQYGFIVKENIIEKFINLSMDKPSTIILPAIEQVQNTPNNTSLLNINNKNIDNFPSNWDYMQYIEGGIKIANGCFDGIKNATIIIPQNTSVALDDKSFQKGASINLILPANMSIKTINTSYKATERKPSNRYELIADKNLKVDITGKTMVLSQDYNFHPQTQYGVSIENKYCFSPNKTKVVPAQIEKFSISKKPEDSLYSFWFLTDQDVDRLCHSIKCLFPNVFAQKPKIVKLAGHTKQASDKRAYFIYDRPTTDLTKFVIAFNLQDCNVYSYVAQNYAPYQIPESAKPNKILSKTWELFLENYAKQNAKDFPLCNDDL